MSDDSSMLRGATVIEALLVAGVKDVVLAPGSRSAPLALAVAAAEREGRIRLHVRIDERSAGYLALGLAKGSDAPVAVITTSGTAAVNLHPAVVEACYGGVPLIAITADRPPRLRGVGANQTIEQAELFGGECRFTLDLTSPDAAADATAVATAIAAATDARHPGPVHLNVALEEPLVSTETVVQIARSRLSALQPAETQSPSVADEVDPPSSGVVTSPRGVIIVGDTAGFPREAAATELIESLAERTGWPIISEPSGNASRLGRALRHGPLVVDDEDFLADHVPDIVVTIGRVGLHRGVMRMIARADEHWVVDPRPAGYACDPLRTAQTVLDSLPELFTMIQVIGDPMWLSGWQEADDRQAQRVAAVWPADSPGALDGVQVVRTVVSTLTDADNVVIGPSWPVRHLSAYAGPIRARVFANRGTSGIDGVVSTAWGIAGSTDAFTIAIAGDLTAIYDRNGLLAAPGEPHPHLVYVVIDNDGGGIFSELEQGAPEFAVDYERVFGTPHGARLTSLLDAPGVTRHEAADATRLREALELSRVARGVHIIAVSTLERQTQVDRLRSFSEDAS